APGVKVREHVRVVRCEERGVPNRPEPVDDVERPGDQEQDRDKERSAYTSHSELLSGDPGRATDAYSAAWFARTRVAPPRGITCPRARLAKCALAARFEMLDPHHLQRFVDAQDEGGTYPAVLAELRAGCKRSHWMWFVFPQLAGLGRSPVARIYAIASLA